MAREDLKILREVALSDCPPDKALWTCHGVIIRNIYELKSEIRNMNDFSFKYHVNDDKHKNDFAKWIREVLHDDQLAKWLDKCIDRTMYANFIDDRIKQLEAA
ncbi:hypothetical protein KY362_05580 [Candidatus Woesearchaeota archaeon]|nr:hypothetical protein [Candidatus Woesearchaeota archaeon]